MRSQAWLRVAREAKALTEQASQMARGKLTLRRGPGPTVFFLHGLYASEAVFRPLASTLARNVDASISAISYGPGPGIVELASRALVALKEERSEAKIHLVGHSLGGLAITYLVHHMVQDPRIASVTLLCPPFRGSSKAVLVPGQASLDLRADSPVLEKLRGGAASGLGPPLLSLFAEDDDLILMPARPTFGEARTLSGVGHNGILFDPRAHEAIVGRVAS